MIDSIEMQRTLAFGNMGKQITIFLTLFKRFSELSALLYALSPCCHVRFQSAPPDRDCESCLRGTQVCLSCNAMHFRDQPHYIRPEH